MAAPGGWWSKRQIEYGVHVNAEMVEQHNVIEEETEEDEGDQSDGDRSDGSDKGEDPDYIVAEDNWLYNIAVDMDMNDYRENVDSDGEYSDEDIIQEDGIDHEDMDLVEDPIKRQRWKKRANIDDKCPFFLGQKISKKSTMNDLVKQYALESRRQLYITKNDHLRFRVVCMGTSPKFTTSQQSTKFQKGKSNEEVGEKSSGGQNVLPNKSKIIKRLTKPTCPFAIHISRKTTEDAWQVKTIMGDHECLQTRDVELYTMSYIAKEIEPTLRINPDQTLIALQDELQKKHQIHISIQKIFRAKMIATKRIMGDYKEQYEKLRDYCEELKISNPEYLTKRIVNVKKIIAKSQGPLTPGATAVFNAIKNEASQYNVLVTGSSKYQVKGPRDTQCVVDVEQKTCSCRKWQLTGMPCSHVVAVIWDMSGNDMEVGLPENWVSEIYWLEHWKSVYEHTINPILSKTEWPKSACPTSLTPPQHHTQIGRPKKKRKKSAEEIHEERSSAKKLSRKGSAGTCSKCNNPGHNSRTCKGQGGPTKPTMQLMNFM
ncbi:hypothetical protein E3N88_01214 [Mikania micrantha]|uniref:SWIM-type domain-containing protein n=1 Tax=Mikania micrantha TaxID=192012 RepID=A0A5N6Q2M5_9ASTR|nr:hypothetical protein E3N88_01214 [Mikania micrantha]